MKKIIFTENAPKAIGPYSQAYLAGNTLYCSGQIPIDAKTGQIINGTVKEQTQVCIKNISEVLKSAGFDFSDVVKTTCYLVSMNDFAEFNEEYEKHFISKPARSCVAAKELPKSASVEIEVIAVKD